MRAGALSFLAGIMLLQQFASLPSSYWCLSLLPAGLLLLWRKQLHACLTFCFVLGFCWALVYAQHRLDQHLANELISKDVVITGWITGIPKRHERYTRFEFIVNQLRYNDEQHDTPRHIELSWYGKQVPKLVPGDYWQLQVRLKPPYGTLNPGGFDYEKYLFQHGIRARGYVRKSERNHPDANKNKRLNIDRLRQSIFLKLQNLINDEGNASLIYALAIGERQSMTQDHWRVLRDTGTAHLMAISGLHIGLVAALGFWLGRWGWSIAGQAPLVISAHKVGAITAVCFALAYAMLAGWSIPTQRAFIMVMVVMMGLLFYRNQLTSRVLAFALFIVLLYDPLSVLSAGFWLSFAAVTIIAYAVCGIKTSMSKLKQWGYLQWAISIGLLPLMLLLFQQVSIISPLANLWAIPIVSILVVPLILLAVIMLFLYESFAAFLLKTVMLIIDGIWWLFEFMLQWPWSTWYGALPSWWAIVFSVLGIVLLLTPKYFPAKHLCFIFFLPLFFPATEKPGAGDVHFTLLDVGQGLSAVVQTQKHILVFDTGPKYSERFDSGSRIVIPYLRQRSISKIDTLLVSHEDNDHIGGAYAILNQIPVNKVVTSNAGRFSGYNNVQTCKANNSWHWDGVDFTLLHPTKLFLDNGRKRRQRNNRSCVLKISNGERSVLLTADIEKKAEAALLNEYGENLTSDVLIIPHHGSQTSSSGIFLDAVKPKWALLPVGYLNRYRLPSEHVMQRYRDKAISVYSTAIEGAISFKLLKNQPVELYRHRQHARRYWHTIRN